MVAVGVGAAAFCGDAVTITTNPWYKAGFGSVAAFLVAMGIGVAKRSDP
jgi:hypothetical protein